MGDMINNKKAKETSVNTKINDIVNVLSKNIEKIKKQRKKLNKTILRNGISITLYDMHNNNVMIYVGKKIITPHYLIISNTVSHKAIKKESLFGINKKLKYKKHTDTINISQEMFVIYVIDDNIVIFTFYITDWNRSYELHIAFDMDKYKGDIITDIQNITKKIFDGFDDDIQDKVNSTFVDLYKRVMETYANVSDMNKVLQNTKNMNI